MPGPAAVGASPLSVRHRSYLAWRVGAGLCGRGMVVHTLVVGPNRRRPLRENVDVVAWFGMAWVGVLGMLMSRTFPLSRRVASAAAAAPSLPVDNHLTIM